jgi:DNA-binding beta-propeller fold protein YncE
MDGSGMEANFKYPEGVAVDTNGKVYVADGYSNKIRKISPE